MITWMTRASLMDSALDLDSALLIQTGDAVFQVLEDMMSEDGTADAAARGWIGHESALAAYAACCSTVLVSRGIHRTAHVLELSKMVKEFQDVWGSFDRPAWVEDHDVLRSHRSNLVRRMPERYGSSWAGTPERWPYLFPVMDGHGDYTLVVSRADKARLSSGERKLPKATKARISNL